MQEKGNMTANKEKNVPMISQQCCCCMCGDSGLTHELFQCNACHFRSQHRYCSNLYPKAESYEVCNWCLDQKADSKSRNNSSASSPSYNKDNSENDDSKNKRKGTDQHPNHGAGFKRTQRNNNLKLESVNKRPTGKPKSPEKRPPCTIRKRIISKARLEEKFKTSTATTKSEEKSNGGQITRHVFRNKVQRYKLLDEVSS